MDLCDEGQSARDAMLLALTMDEWSKSQGMRVASRNWKWQGHGFSLRASKKRHIYTDTLIFIQ